MNVALGTRYATRRRSIHFSSYARVVVRNYHCYAINASTENRVLGRAKRRPEVKIPSNPNRLTRG